MSKMHCFTFSSACVSPSVQVKQKKVDIWTEKRDLRVENAIKPLIRTDGGGFAIDNRTVRGVTTDGSACILASSAPRNVLTNIDLKLSANDPPRLIC